MHTLQSKKILMLRPKDIKLPLSKSLNGENGYSIYSLADSIKQIGIIEPIVIRKTENGKYELVSGERRLKGAIIAGLRRVPCVVHDVGESEAAIYNTATNLQIKNRHFFEEADSIKRVMTKYRITHIEMALKLGISQNALLERLRLLRLPEEIRIKIEEAQLSESHARSLLSLPPNMREKVLEKIIADNLTSLQTENLVNEILSPKPTQMPKAVETNAQKPPCRKSAIGDIRLFSNSLQKLTSTLKNSGIDAFVRRTENERYIEYKVRIKKDEPPKEIPEQLKIC